MTMTREKGIFCGLFIIFLACRALPILLVAYPHFPTAAAICPITLSRTTASKTRLPCSALFKTATSTQLLVSDVVRIKLWCS